MYHSKHQNGYRISHKTPKRKFRTWKSKKKWLYGLTLITLTVSSLLPLGNLAFIPKTENTCSNKLFWNFGSRKYKL